MTSGGYLLDTDYVIDLLKGKQYAPTLLEKLLTNLSTRPQAGLSISIITFAEVYEGIYRGYAQKEHEQAFLDFTRIVEVYGITRPVAKRYALIRGSLLKKDCLLTSLIYSLQQQPSITISH